MVKRRNSLFGFSLLQWLLAVGAFLFASTAICAAGLAQAPERAVRSATRPGQAIRTASIHWDNVPLRDAIARLSSAFRATVFVDRRLDPSQRIRLKIENASLDDVLRQLAAEHQWGTNRVGSVFYLGPMTQADALRVVVDERSDEIHALPPDLRDTLEAKQSVDWPRLASPRELVIAAAGECGWQVRGEDRIPHDLWPAGRLPNLPLADGLSLLLIGFDLTFRIDSAQQTIEIVPLDDRLASNRTQDFSRAESRSSAVPRQQLPSDRSTASRGRSSSQRRGDRRRAVTDLVPEQLNRVRKPSTKTETKRRYTLRVEEQPVGAVLRQLADRLGWDLRIDEKAIREADLSLDRRISFSLENADEEKLLEALLTPAELTFQRDGQQLRIVPKTAPTNRD